MSTPSTATTTIPAHHSQYGYAQHNPCSASSSSYPANNSVPAPRLTASYHTFPTTNSNSSYTRNQRSPQSSKQPSHAASMATSQSASARPRNQKKPDWQEFYKNGIPKEIIVIDDDSPPPKPPPRTASRRGGKAAAAGSTQSMAGRKRKVDQGYDTGYHDSPAFSTHPARFGENSSDASLSTDRTTSLQTTAPTSLGSYGSSGASNSYEDVTIGQKRKRTQPQATTRAQTKRKAQDDAFAVYVPPPKPPLKAPEVHVPVVHDVSCLHLAAWQLLIFHSISPSTKRSTTKMATTSSPQILISLTDVSSRHIKPRNFTS
jgi:dual-specificity kinase